MHAQLFTSSFFPPLSKDLLLKAKMGFLIKAILMINFLQAIATWLIVLSKWNLGDKIHKYKCLGKNFFLKLVQLLWHTAPIFQKFKIFGIWSPKCRGQNRPKFRPNRPNRPGPRKYTYISSLTPNHISIHAIAVAQCSCLFWARKMIPPFSGFSNEFLSFERTSADTNVVWICPGERVSRKSKKSCSENFWYLCFREKSLSLT